MNNTEKLKVKRPSITPPKTDFESKMGVDKGSDSLSEIEDGITPNKNPENPSLINDLNGQEFTPESVLKVSLEEYQNILTINEAFEIMYNDPDRAEELIRTIDLNTIDPDKYERMTGMTLSGVVNNFEQNKIIDTDTATAINLHRDIIKDRYKNRENQNQENNIYKKNNY